MGEGEPSCRRELEQGREEEEEIVRQAYKYREKITVPVVGSCRVDPIPRKLEVAACTPPLPPTTTNLPHINRMTGYIYIGVQFLAAPAQLGTTIMPPNWMVTGFQLGKLQEDTGYCA
jgi:hypothetical protein